MYPLDKRSNSGKLRLLYECAPLSYIAEQAGGKVVYICLGKTIEKKSTYLKNFLFLGFKQLTEEEQREISMTRTHSMLKYSFDDEGEL